MNYTMKQTHQIQEDNYTKIENHVLQALLLSNLSSAELKVAFFVLRKLNGFHKEEDEISYSQFMEGTGLSRQTVANCLSQLRLVNIIRLVKKGVSKKCSNRWSFNKDTSTWQLVKRTRLVKFPSPTSQISGKQLVKLSRHTKESTKENILQKKDICSSEDTPTTDKGCTVSLKEVVDYFNEKVGTKHKPINKLEGMLKARLKDGFTKEEIFKAIDNAKTSKFLMGENDNKKRYLTPEYILRADKLDVWVSYQPVRKKQFENEDIDTKYW